MNMETIRYRNLAGAAMPARAKDGLRMPPVLRRAALTAGICLMLGLMSMPAAGAGGVDPDADKILRAMSSYLGGATAFSVNADIGNEIITHYPGGSEAAVLQLRDDYHETAGQIPCPAKRHVCGCDVYI